MQATVKQARQVSEDGSVAIDGTGSPQAFGGSRGAGIGGTDGMTAGSITINSADITAVGGTDAAGIGGGKPRRGYRDRLKRRDCYGGRRRIRYRNRKKQLP